MKNVEVNWKNNKRTTKFEDINSWELHDHKDILIIEDFEDVTHYLNLNEIEGFTVEDK